MLDVPCRRKKKEEIMSKQLGDMWVRIRGEKYMRAGQFAQFADFLKKNGFDPDTTKEWVNLDTTEAEAKKIWRDIAPEVPQTMVIDWVWVPVRRFWE